MKFVENYPLDQVKPAPYNPRVITAEAQERLRLSINELGPIRTFIVNANGTLIAGHQRTAAMKRLGMTHAPAFVSDVVVSTREEIRFNQLHNACDRDITSSVVRVPPQPLGWSVLEPNEIIVVDNGRTATLFQSLGRLLALHGPWANVVADESGNVIVGASYAIISKNLNIPVTVKTIKQEIVETTKKYFSGDYGSFSYEHLPQRSWTQSLVSTPRLRNGSGDNTNCHGSRSQLYDNVVIPNLKPSDRLCDFGYGRGDYMKMLGKKGQRVFGFEPFLRFNDSHSLDHRQRNKDIDQLCESLQTDGLFDVVVCNAVLNSTDRMEAEIALIASVNALCKPGGFIAFSGRLLEHVDSYENSKIARGQVRRVEFLDKDNYSAFYRSGEWTYQKFHSKEQVKEIGKTSIGDYAYKIMSNVYFVYGKKTVESENQEAGLDYEFNLPLPNNQRIGRSEDVISAWKMALKLSGVTQ